MDTSAPFNIKGSNKIFIVGPCVKKNSKDLFRHWIEREAAKLGDVEEIFVDELPGAYSFPEVKAKGLVPVAATVKFSAPGTASKFIAAHHGKLYDKMTAMDIQRIDERLCIIDILNHCGPPDLLETENMDA